MKKEIRSKSKTSREKPKKRSLKCNLKAVKILKNGKHNKNILWVSKK